MGSSTKQPDRSNAVFILAGTSHEYTKARQKLGLTPSQAFWLTRTVLLSGLHKPKVYRVGAWQSLLNIHDVEAAMSAAEADVVDLD